MLERDPIQFITKTGPEYLSASKKELAKFIHCNPDDFVYVTNPSTAGNIIIKGLKLNAGDEILTTNHEYGAMDRTWRYVCRRNGARYVQQSIPIPIRSKESFLDAFWRGLTPKTRIIFISHITSSTGLIFPVKEVCEKAKELGLMTIVDGAHVPGQLPLNLQELKVDIYIGACHKWLMTPKGSSFLYVKEEFQNDFDPLIISWGYEAEFPSHSQFLDYHEYQGTRDFSAFLTTPAALKFRLDYGWEEKTAGARERIRHYYPILCGLMETSPICPVSEEFLGQMCSIPTPTSDPEKLKETLFNEYKIEIPVTKMEDKTFIRISIQPYTTDREVEALIDAIKDIKSKSNLIANIH